MCLSVTWRLLPIFGLQDSTGQTIKLDGGFFSNLGAFAHFLLPDSTGNHPDDGCIFSNRKPFLFNNIIMHLLQSYTHCYLDHSCSILHKLRDTVTWFSFSVGRAMEVPIPNCTGTHYQTVGGSHPEGYWLASTSPQDPHSWNPVHSTGSIIRWMPSVVTSFNFIFAAWISGGCPN